MAKRKWLVKVPVTIVACAEVTAPNSEAAIIAANEICNEICAMYNGGHDPIDRPSLVGLGTEVCDASVFWDQDSLDQCEIFLNSKAEAIQIDGPMEPLRKKK